MDIQRKYILQRVGKIKECSWVDKNMTFFHFLVGAVKIRPPPKLLLENNLICSKVMQPKEDQGDSTIRLKKNLNRRKIIHRGDIIFSNFPIVEIIFAYQCRGIIIIIFENSQ